MSTHNPPRIARIPLAPDALDLRDLEGLQESFDELVERPLSDDGDILVWLTDWTHLYERIYEAGGLAYIEWSRSTGNRRRLQLLRFFQNKVMPIVRLAEDKLNRRLVESEWERDDMVESIRRIRAEIEIFRESNVELLSTDDNLANDYGVLSGNLATNFDGEERTWVELTETYLRSPDRAVRETAWLAIQQLFTGAREQLEALFDEMLRTRATIADNAGFNSYIGFRWEELQRFDYTPADCRGFHRAVLATVVPVVRRRMESRRKLLGLEVLRPWDVLVDPYGEEPLRPFNTGAEMASAAEAAFTAVDPRMGDYIDFMRRHELLDLENRPGKKPGGFQSVLYQRRWPYIFMNATGAGSDMQTLLHEGGHAVHAFLSNQLPLFWQRIVPIEFSEVASMSAELMAGEMLEADNGGPYDRQSYLRSRIAFLDNMLMMIPWITIVDWHQLWMYDNPTHTHEERAANWRRLHELFMVGPDWTGFEELRGYGWHQKLHFFEVPLYYVEYAIAWFGALQVWRNWRQYPWRGLQMWLDALALGGTADLPTLFRAAGAELVFTAQQMKPLVELMIDEIETLEAELLSMPA